MVHSSNLCTEITLNTNKDEIAVCNLGSVNLPQHIDENGLNLDKLRRTVRTAVRMLDNVIDINYYSVPQAKNSNLLHRPVGLGLMGFQDALYKQHIAYGSDERRHLRRPPMEAISYYAIEASSELAVSAAPTAASPAPCGAGAFPIDSLDRLIEHRGADYIQVDRSQTLTGRPCADRENPRHAQFQCHGHRPHRHHRQHYRRIPVHRADLPEPVRQIEPVGRVHGGQPYLVNDLKARGLWDKVMVNDLKYYDGSVQLSTASRRPQGHYATAFEVEPRWLVDSASRRQKWIDQAQSLNLYINNANGKKLDITYRMAWYCGLRPPITCARSPPPAPRSRPSTPAS